MSGWVAEWELGNDADGHRPDNDATIVLDGTEQLQPGAVTDVRLFPTYPQRWSKVAVGDVLGMRDGRNVIGSAMVVEILEPTNEHLLGRWPMFSTVTLKTDFDGMAAGTTGAVIDVFEDAYEIEIVDGDGETHWLGPVGDEHLEILAEGPLA